MDGDGRQDVRHGVRFELNHGLGETDDEVRSLLGTEPRPGKAPRQLGRERSQWRGLGLGSGVYDSVVRPVTHAIEQQLEALGHDLLRQ